MSQVIIEEPDHQLPIRRADPPFQVYRRGHHRRDRRRPPDQFIFRTHRQAKEKRVQTASVRHGMDAGPHRRKQARQRYPSPRRIMAQGQLRWSDANYCTSSGDRWGCVAIGFYRTISNEIQIAKAGPANPTQCTVGGAFALSNRSSMHFPHYADIKLALSFGRTRLQPDRGHGIVLAA